MKQLLDTLTKKMEWDVKDQVYRRYNALVRQYEYLVERQNEHLLFTFQNGWFGDKYKSLFALNSFYQIVIGPLASSTRGVSEIGVGSSIPIAYGKSVRFDEQRNSVINKTYMDYISLVNGLGFQEWWLNVNQASDAVYQIAKSIREDGYEG